MAPETMTIQYTALELSERAAYRDLTALSVKWARRANAESDAYRALAKLTRKWLERSELDRATVALQRRLQATKASEAALAYARKLAAVASRTDAEPFLLTRRAVKVCQPIRRRATRGYVSQPVAVALSIFA